LTLAQEYEAAASCTHFDCVQHCATQDNPRNRTDDRAPAVLPSPSGPGESVVVQGAPLFGISLLDQQDGAVALAAEGAQLIWTSAGPGEVPAGLDYFAQFAAERGEHRRYVRLTAASDALRERYGDPKPPAAWPSRPLWSANARRFLGDQAYAREWRRGQALDIEHAMAYALKVVPSAIGREAEDQVGGRLTRREREVATLIAQGLTDREIAERLVITEGTVGSHGAHIFDKLGMRSRASLATWVAESCVRQMCSDRASVTIPPP
jgi:DNA-binding CsgD family transcriptional regulator